MLCEDERDGEVVEDFVEQGTKVELLQRSAEQKTAEVGDGGCGKSHIELKGGQVGAVLLYGAKPWQVSRHGRHVLAESGFEDIVGSDLKLQLFGATVQEELREMNS